MILSDFVLLSRVNQTWSYSGIDSLEHCMDKKHFKSYPHEISYNYNSRGFRDTEWPDDLEKLKDAVWCVGDSFTVGIGSPIEHTWVCQVSKQLKKQTINVSMDGASNEWIARKVIQICETVSPKLIIIQWSYTNRREHKDLKLSDEARRIHCEKHAENNDIENTISCIESVVKKSTSNVIHSFIPDFAYNVVDKPQLRLKIKNLEITSIPEIIKLDTARDGHHYDILTAEKFSADVRDLLANRRS
jgi:hypothetical protein